MNIVNNILQLRNLHVKQILDIFLRNFNNCQQN